MEPLPPFVARRVIRGRYVFSPSGGRVAPRSIRVVCAGYEECSADYELERENFPYAAVEYISGGMWELASGGRVWKLEPGMIFTYGPGVSYTIRARSRVGLRKYFVDFEGPDVAGVMRRAGLNPGVPERLAHPRWLQDLMEQLIDTARLKSPKRQKLGSILAGLILTRLPMDREVGGSQQMASRLSYDRCREYLSRHYLEIKDFALAAKMCGVSPVHMCRLFRRYAGETPHVFVTRLKINHAAELIVRGDVAVKAAALEVGYADPYHFSRVFKAMHGQAPSKFRGGRP